MRRNFSILQFLRVGGVHQSRSEKRSSQVCSLSDQSSQSALLLSERIQEALQVNVFNEPQAVQAKNSEDLQVLEYLEETEIFYIVKVMSYGVGGTIQGHLDTVATNSEFYRDEK